VLGDAFRSPAFDKAKVRQLLDLPRYSHRGTYGDEQVQVRVVNP
jgi:hypothetical protein